MNKHGQRRTQGVEWDTLDAAWKAGIKSPYQLADEYEQRSGYRPAVKTIVQHYATAGVPRDLSGQITAAATAKARQVAGELLTPEEVALLKLRELDEEIIEANASTIAGALIGHRRAVKRYHTLALQLLSEIEAQTINVEELYALGTMMRSENERGVDKLNDIYQKVIATPGRVDAIKKLAETSKILIGLERQALGVADNANGDANNPAAAEEDMPPKEVAQRVAFMLMRAQAEQAKADRVRTIDIAPAQPAENSEFDMGNLA